MDAFPLRRTSGTSTQSISNIKTFNISCTSTTDNLNKPTTSNSLSTSTINSNYLSKTRNFNTSMNSRNFNTSANNNSLNTSTTNKEFNLIHDQQWLQPLWRRRKVVVQQGEIQWSVFHCAKKNATIFSNSQFVAKASHPTNVLEWAVLASIQVPYH